MVPLMKFKDFIWSKNPETFNISITRDIKELSIPFHGSVMQDYGEQASFRENDVWRHIKSWQHCLKAEKAAYYHCLIFLLSLQSLFLFLI